MWPNGYYSLQRAVLPNWNGSVTVFIFHGSNRPLSTYHGANFQMEMKGLIVLILESVGND
jgi:hypothetical protein